MDCNSKNNRTAACFSINVLRLLTLNPCKQMSFIYLVQRFRLDMNIILHSVSCAADGLSDLAGEDVLRCGDEHSCSGASERVQWDGKRGQEKSPLLGWQIVCDPRLILEFSSNDHQAEWKREHSGLDPGWPTEGRIEFRGFGLRYRRNLDLAIRNIAVSISGGEKVWHCFVHRQLTLTPTHLQYSWETK